MRRVICSRTSAARRRQAGERSPSRSRRACTKPADARDARDESGDWRRRSWSACVPVRSPRRAPSEGTRALNSARRRRRQAGRRFASEGASAARNTRFLLALRTGDEWKSNANVQLQQVGEKDVDLAAGQRMRVDFRSNGWLPAGGFDPETKLTTVYPFFAGYSWDDENLARRRGRTR